MYQAFLGYYSLTNTFFSPGTPFSPKNSTSSSDISALHIGHVLYMSGVFSILFM